MKHAYLSGIVILVGSLSLSCSATKSVVSAVPGASYVPGLQPQQEAGSTAAGEKIHFKISPDEALQILADVAPAHGWELDAVGEQYDLQGLRGKYFRLLTRRFIGGVFEMNGVFFSEPTGTYIVVGNKDTGFPQDLVAPFTAAVTGKTGQTDFADPAEAKAMLGDGKAQEAGAPPAGRADAGMTPSPAQDDNAKMP